MRRLNEILDVPKAWYKRGLMQRIFLGKDGTYATQQSTHQACKIRISRNLPASSDASKPDPLVIPKETSGMATPPISAFLSVKKTSGGLKFFFFFVQRLSLKIDNFLIFFLT